MRKFTITQERMFTITREVNAMDILVGILILVLGASVATMGLRLWFWMLPILGFMTGFFLGAIFILGLVGDGILETALSWIVGIIAGIAFALISWFWWYFGVIIASASAGASLVTAIVASFGVDNDWALLLISILGAVLFAFVALMLALPLYIVIASTAIAGGIGVVSGLLLVFDQIHISDLGEGNAVAVINNSLGWWLLWLAVAAVGIVVQLRYTAVVALPEERYVRTTRAIRP